MMLSRLRGRKPSNPGGQLKSPKRWPGLPRGAPRYCEYPSCTQSTREGKPFCSDHVEEHPYVQRLVAELKEQEEEQEAARMKGYKAVNVQGTTATELLHLLQLRGARTVERLARELNLDQKVLDAYIAALLKKDLVKLGETKRGSTTVSLKKASLDTAGKCSA